MSTYSSQTTRPYLFFPRQPTGSKKHSCHRIRLLPFLQFTSFFYHAMLKRFVGDLKTQPNYKFKPGKPRLCQEVFVGMEIKKTLVFRYLTSISRLCRISLLWPSIMWSPESTTRSGWNSSKLDTNTSSIFKAPFDRSWEKIKRLALGAFTCPHSSPSVQ